MLPESKLTETPASIRLDPPFRFSMTSLPLNVAAFIARLNVTSTVFTVELRGSGETSTTSRIVAGAVPAHRTACSSSRSAFPLRSEVVSEPRADSRSVGNFE